MSISENLARVHEQIFTAARRSGRNPDEILLMAVSKTQPTEKIREAYAAGQRLFGENRVQEFAAKAVELHDLHELDLHLIGHLQTNKAAKSAELFSAVDSLDSLRLAEKLNAAAGILNKKLRVLIEVNVGGEAAKSGVAPESAEFDELLRAVPRLDSLVFRGLMTVPPFTENPEGARPYFHKLRDLGNKISARKFPWISMDELSMGMSHDFEVAIEEGSTCVRVGTAIFGARAKA